MIPSEKGLVFGEFWYVSSKISKKPFFLLLAFAIVSGFRVGAWALNKIASDPERSKSLYDSRISI
jgi:hypothetical protein